MLSITKSSSVTFESCRIWCVLQCVCWCECHRFLQSWSHYDAGGCPWFLPLRAWFWAGRWQPGWAALAGARSPHPSPAGHSGQYGTNLAASLEPGTSLTHPRLEPVHTLHKLSWHSKLNAVNPGHKEHEENNFLNKTYFISPPTEMPRLEAPN